MLEGGNAIELHDGNKNGGHVSYWHMSQFKCSVISLELMKKKRYLWTGDLKDLLKQNVIHAVEQQPQ